MHEKGGGRTIEKQDRQSHQGKKTRDVIKNVGFLLSVDECKIGSHTIEKEGSNSTAPLEERKVPIEPHHWRIGKFQLNRTIGGEECSNSATPSDERKIPTQPYH